MYYSFPKFTLPSIFVGSILMSSWASTTHFIPLGILGSFHFFLLLTFPWVLAKSFKLPRPNYHIFYFWVYWPAFEPISFTNSFFGLLRPIFASFLLLIILMGLRLPSFWAHLLSLGPFYYFLGLYNIIPAILLSLGPFYYFLGLYNIIPAILLSLGPFYYFLGLYNIIPAIWA